MSGSLAASIEAYAAVTREFVACMALVPDAAWATPRATGKWSPAQESEHITLAHEVFAAQLAGGPPMAVVVSGWQRLALHWIVMPWILRTGRFPRARSPREARPSREPLPRVALSARLERAALAIRADLERRGRDACTHRLDHPYFGTMTAVQVLRLTEVHTRHHLVTLSASAAVSAAG